MPQVLGDKPFDCRYLPTRMYQMKPYYEQTINTNTVDGNMELEEMLQILKSLNVNDPNTLLAVNDVLSRQMLLLCRLNHVDRLCNESHYLNNVLFSPEARKQFTSPKGVKNIVVHFDIENIPFSLLCVLKVIKQDHGIRTLIQLHQHSTFTSVPNHHYQLNLLQQKLNILNFCFDDFDRLRADVDLVITLVVKCLLEPKRCYGILKSNEPPVFDELFIIQDITKLLVTEKQWKIQEPLWYLMHPKMFESDQNIIEFFAGYCVELSDQKFSIPNLPYPTIYDVLLWSLIQSGNQCLNSLINFRFQKCLHKFIIGN